MRLDVARARRALAPLARRLGRSVEAAAAGVVAVVNAGMERALRVITVERGHDPRDFALVAFGGAGGLHAAELARALGMRRVYVPRHPGLLSAWGVLAAEADPRLRADAAPRVAAAAPCSRAAFATLARARGARCAREGVAGRASSAALDVRYAGQSYELTVPYAPRLAARLPRPPPAPLRPRGARAAARGGDAARARARRARLRLPRDARAARGAARAARDAPGRTSTAARCRRRCYRRDELRAGGALRGPAVICEYSATTVVPPGWRLLVEPLGGLVLEDRDA